MYPIYFDALLKAEDQKILELGEACISPDENKITFKSDFVPLFKLDERVNIIRVLGEKQFEVFEGLVYLSSRNLLQITSVDEQLLQGARRLFDVNAQIPVTLTVSPEQSPNFSVKKAEQVSATVRFVSDTVVKLATMQYVGEGHYLYLYAEQPVSLKKTFLRVEERHLLSKRAAICICSVVSQPEGEKEALRQYLEQLRLELWPDEEPSSD